MKRAHGWSVLVVVLATMLVFTPLSVAQGQGQGNTSGQTTVVVTVDPPSSGGGAIIQRTEVSNLDLVASPDNPTATATVTLLVYVDQAVSKISVSAEISNKNHLKIKWYNLLENGHFLIKDNPGSSTKGSSWGFGTVWESTGESVSAGEYRIDIPVVLDLTAGGTVNPRNIPAGSTNPNTTIVWTLVVGSL